MQISGRIAFQAEGRASQLEASVARMQVEMESGDTESQILYSLVEMGNGCKVLSI